MLSVSQGVNVESGAGVELMGGGLTSVYDGVIIDTGGSIQGFGTVAASQFVQEEPCENEGLIRNGGLIEGFIGETLTLSGLTFENQPDGILRAPAGALVHVASTSVTQNGKIELTAPAAIRFDVTLENDGEIEGSGTIDADVVNDGQITDIGCLLIDGSLQNNGVIVILSCTQTVTGNLSGSGEISGTFSGGRGAEPGATRSNSGLAVAGDCAPGADATLNIINGTVNVAGNFDVAINNNMHYDMAQSELRMVGLEESSVQTLEVMSTNLGPSDAGLDRTQPGRYPLHTLTIAKPFTTVQLKDIHDNDGLGQGSCEAIYAENVIIEQGATVITMNCGAACPSGCKVYYSSLTNNGAVDVPANLVEIGGPCTVAPPPVAEPTLPDVGSGTRVRYLAFSADSASAGQSQAIRVKLTDLPAPFEYGEGRVMWVGQPIDVSEIAGKLDSTPPTFKLAQLQCDPFFADWTTYGVVYVRSESLVPRGLYDIQVIYQEGCVLTNAQDYSDPLPVTLSKWGDTVGGNNAASPQGTVDFNDISSVVDKFKNVGTAPSKSRTDVAPSLPDRIVDFVDIPSIVDGFKGRPYPYPGPPVTDPCP
jgi:hypothetical protein